MGWFLLLLVVGVVVLAVGANSETPGGESGAVPPAEAQQNYLDVIEQSFDKGYLPVAEIEEARSLPIVLKQGEQVVFSCPGTRFCEERAERVFGGASLRVVRGVRVFVGSSGSIHRLAPVDAGPLVLTNRRLFFAGARRGLSVSLAALSGLRYSPEVLEVYRSGRVKKMQFQHALGMEIIGRLIECLLSRDKWFFYDGEYGRGFVWEGSEISQGFGPVSDSPRPEERTPKVSLLDEETMIASFLAAAALADGSLDEVKVERISNLVDGMDRTPDFCRQIVDELRRIVRDLTAGDVPPTLEGAIETALKLDGEYRDFLLELVTGVVESDGRLSEPERVLLTYIRRRLRR